MFPSRATISRRPVGDDVTQDAEGGLTDTPVDVFTDVACQFGSLTMMLDSEDARVEGEFQDRRYSCFLDGDYDVREYDLATIEGTTYDVVGVSHDSWAVVTALHLEAR